jgi:hypothetical protein
MDGQVPLTSAACPGRRMGHPPESAIRGEWAESNAASGGERTICITSLNGLALRDGDRGNWPTRCPVTWIRSRIGS